MKLLEKLLIDGEVEGDTFQGHDRYVAGVLLWSKRDIVETDDGPVRYLEASVERSKTSRTLEKR